MSNSMEENYIKIRCGYDNKQDMEKIHNFH